MNKQKIKQQNVQVQKVQKQAFEHKIFKKLYYPNTQTNRKLFQVLNLEAKEKCNLYFQLQFDVSQWINVPMMIELRNYEISSQQNVKNDKRFIFFSRTLIREIIKHFIILVQQLEKNNLFLISLDFNEIWVNFKINQNMIEFKNIVILNEFSQDNLYLAEHKKKIKLIILKLAQQYSITDNYIEDFTSYTQLIGYIEGQLKDKQAEFIQDYHRPYNQTNLEQYIIPKLIQNIKEPILSITNNFYYELNLYQMIKGKQNDELQQKMKILQQQVEQFIKQYDIFFNEINKSQYLREQIVFQLLEGIKSQKYINYLQNFIISDFNLDACLQKSWIQTKIQQLIIEEESPIKKYILQKIIIELFQKGPNIKFKLLSAYVDDLNLQIRRKLQIFITQMAQHLNLNISLSKILKESKKFDYIYDEVSLNLIGKLESELKEEILIEQSLIQLIPDIKRTLIDILQEFIQDL